MQQTLGTREGAAGAVAEQILRKHSKAYDEISLICYAFWSYAALDFQFDLNR